MLNLIFDSATSSSLIIVSGPHALSFLQLQLDLSDDFRELAAAGAWWQYRGV